MKNISFASKAILLCFLSLLIFLPDTTRAQILTYTNDSSGALNLVATNATANALSRVDGATRPGTPCNTGYSAASFPTATTYASSLPGIETSVSANTGYALQVTGFSVGIRRSGSGPANARFAYSTDGGTTWIDQGIDQSPNNASCGTTTTAVWTTSLTVTAPTQLKFRVYGFNASVTTGTLQIMNLVINGNVTGAGSSCGVPTGLSASAITSTSATLSWATVTGATSYTIQYRPIGTTTWSTTSSGSTSVGVSGLTAATSYEFEVEAICSSGPSGFSSTGAFTTLGGVASSGSSGKMAIYFNTPVNNTVSTGVNAVYLPSHMADTVVAYINRAKYSIDIAQYDYNQSSGFANIATAVDNAYAAGKKVRWIYDGSQPNTGLALLNSGIHTLGSPTTSAYGIMHDKFVIIDAQSSNPNDAIVCTGSEDWGVTQFNSDANNILFIQDSALAHAYTNEFNMMWGDTGIAPNSSLSKFGPYKTDLGAHLFTIGGKTVELYFSPSDHTDTHIQSTINSANTDLYFGVYDFTVAADANAITARHTAGVYVTGIVDQYSNTGAAYPILTSALGSNMKTYTSSSLVYHNKMVIVDPSDNCSDPSVLTGSHNWTTSANTKNDENTLIIHNDTVANIYYQSYYANFTALGGTMTTIPNCTTTTCGNATGLIATSITSTSALLNWSVASGAVSYNVQYRPTGTTTWSTTTSPTNSVTITGLAPATTYEFQVETVCSSGTSTYSSSTIFTTLALPCSVPTGLNVTGITNSSATLNWTAVSGAISYNVEYRTLGAGSWTTTSSPVNSFTLSGLASGTSYEFAIEVVCASGTSGYSVTDTFTTTTVTCAVPSAPSITVMSPGSVTLNWSAVTGAVSYSIEYQAVGTSGWMHTTSTATSKLIIGLTPATTYQFQVQAICSSSDSSGYGSAGIATTMSSTTQIGVVSEDAGSLRMSPNPTTGAVTAIYSLTTSTNVSMEVYDLVGRLVNKVLASEQQEAGDYQYKFTLPEPGIYFVKLSAGGVSVTKKVVRL